MHETLPGYSSGVVDVETTEEQPSLQMQRLKRGVKDGPESVCERERNLVGGVDEESIMIRHAPFLPVYLDQDISLTPVSRRRHNGRRRQATCVFPMTSSTAVDVLHKAETTSDHAPMY